MSTGPAWLAAAAGAAGAGAAWFAAANGVRTLRQTRRDSISKSRPMVAAEFRDARPSPSTLYLVIRNYGPSVAKNIKITFAPEIIETSSESLASYIRARYSKKIPTLTPGAELKNIYYVGESRDGVFVNSEPMPEQVVVTISYESADSKQVYTDAYDLDVEVMKGETWSSSSLSMENQAKEVRASLKKIAQSIQSIDRSIKGRRE
ncbi:COG1361 family protein [Streptomyces marincola]|uniref:hypothetical protein n=1 Tax=Streptomyces marincola TaxID=2878388 RepID=UPI001CF561C7|nr:hypothetical protein [Streptomyces marincola]UCM88903.1 hypothetical protein LC193_13615 [Streptomyces marincola]